jgi:hypothetical protein
MLPHIIPLFKLLSGATEGIENPGKVPADNTADAIIVFFANCLLFMI